MMIYISAEAPRKSQGLVGGERSGRKKKKGSLSGLVHGQAAEGRVVLFLLLFLHH